MPTHTVNIPDVLSAIPITPSSCVKASLTDHSAYLCRPHTDHSSRQRVSTALEHARARSMCTDTSECALSNGGHGGATLCDQFPLTDTPSVYPGDADVHEQLMAGDFCLRLLAGECVRCVARVCGDCVLFATNYRLLVVCDVTRAQSSGAPPTVCACVPCSAVDTIELKDMIVLNIMCKFGHIYRLKAPTADCALFLNKHLTSLILSSASTLQACFALFFRAWNNRSSAEFVCSAASNCSQIPHFVPISQFNRFWSLESFQSEMCRLQFDLSTCWRISSANESGQLCRSYPPHLLVPQCVSDTTLAAASAFRPMGRVPTVCWRDRVQGTVLLRSAQPEIGWLGWRCAEDEQLVRAVRDAACANLLLPQLTTSTTVAAGRTSPHTVSTTHDEPRDLSDEARYVFNSTHMGFAIVDARSYTAAVANRARGGGVECVEYYDRCELVFMNLPNIHVVRRSFHALRALFGQSATDRSDGTWLSDVEATTWCTHLLALLRAAVSVCRYLHQLRCSVLVHCSDGWDRTPQITSLTELMLDSHYRTFEGFELLVAREWLMFGHKFADRCGVGNMCTDSNERCPIFLQWLDCVHQLCLQFPCDFQFNTHYLVFLGTHVYSNLFGTFLCNSISESMKNDIHSRTYSIFAYLSSNRDIFTNYMYQPSYENKIIQPSLHPQNVHIWTDMYTPLCTHPPWAITQSHYQSSARVSHAQTSADPPLHTQRGAPSQDSAPQLLVTPAVNPAVTAAADSHTDTCTPPHATHSADVTQCVAGSHSVARESMSRSVEELSTNFCFELNTKSGSRAWMNSDPARLTRDSASPTHMSHTATVAVLEDSGNAEEERSIHCVRQSHEGADHSQSRDTHTDTCAHSASQPNLSQQQQQKSEVSAVNRWHSSTCETSDRSTSTSDLRQVGTCWSGDPSAPTSRCVGVSTQHSCTADLSSDQYLGIRLGLDGLLHFRDEAQQNLIELKILHKYEIDSLKHELEMARRALYEQNREYVSCANVDMSTDSKDSDTWEKVDTTDTHPPLWMPDFAASRCASCNQLFWMARRRHHCRCCGNIYCAQCSKHEVALPHAQLFAPVRVCSPCFRRIQQNGRSLSSSNSVSTMVHDSPRPPVALDQSEHDGSVCARIYDSCPDRLYDL